MKTIFGLCSVAGIFPLVRRNVQRPDLSLEQLGPNLEPGPALGLSSGDAWDTRGEVWLLTSDQLTDGWDRLDLATADGVVIRGMEFGAPLSAISLLEPEAGEAAVAEWHGGAGLVSVLRWR